MSAARPAAGRPAREGARGTVVPVDAGQERAMADCVAAALAQARRAGAGRLASVTLEAPGELDPTAVAMASRRTGEAWFCFDQPARGGRALAALGAVRTIEASGPDRFSVLSSRWREACRESVGSAIAGDGAGAGHPGAHGGPLAVGGFAFAPDGGSTQAWSGFAPASFVVPEVALRRGGEGGPRVTVSAEVAPDDVAEEVVARMMERVGSLRAAPLPLLDPAPAGEYRVASAMAPQHFEAAVARARELIGAGEIEKVVLAREVQVHAPLEHDPAAVLGALREAFETCFIYGVGRGDAAWLGASPELLVRREGQRVSTMALAGSARRSADPAVDAHIGERLLRSQSYREEHAIVVRRIERDLRPLAVWIASAPEPALVKVANIQHLGTPIRAQLAAPHDVLELGGRLHPTPAVGGEPAPRARELIPALEGLDRGWYAGPVGWIDGTGDGELCVALRCALLRGRSAHLYAGNGIVRDSDPAAELAETEVKLAALLPLLAG